MKDVILTAVQRDGTPDAVARACMAQDGPPFIFACDESRPVGTEFAFAGQLFVIVRHCTRDEYVTRQMQIGAPVGAGVGYYFEAATD